MKYCMHCMQPVLEEDKECPFCGRKIDKECSAHHLLPGTILHERFLVGKAIGQGGFGITYIGRDMMLEIPIAIKEYYPGSYVSRNNTVSPVVTCNIVKDEDAMFEKGKESFLQEAKILAKFSGEPGIVSVRDFFEENNTAYIVMEYVDGEDLKTYLKNHGKMLPEKTIELMMPIMQALEKIHARGLVHRDISPDNIRLCENGVKLLDFGAARQVSAAFNRSLSVVLKPGYAPYEQYYTNGRQSSWTDIYSLCATMYYCITGITPAEAPARLLKDTVKTPTAFGIDMNPVMEEALMKGLSVKSEDRFESVSELLFGLQGDGAGPGYKGPTLPNPERPRMEETEIPAVEKPIAERIVPEEKQTLGTKQKKNPGTDRKVGTVFWKAGAFVVLVVAAILLGFWIRGLGEEEETDAFLTTTPIPTESPTPTVELTPTTEPVPTESPAPTTEPVPTEPPTPTIESTPTPTAEPTPTPTVEPTPVAEGKNLRYGIALTTYQEENVSYTPRSWWIASEVNLLIENIPEKIWKGKADITVFIPYEALTGGIYCIEAELLAGKTREESFGSGGSVKAEFRIINGIISGRNFNNYTDTGAGYLLELSLEYGLERIAEECNMIIKVHSSTAEKNGRFYINSICLEDEATGYRSLDLTGQEPVYSMVRFGTGEKLNLWEIIPRVETEEDVSPTPLVKALKEECTTGLAVLPYDNSGAVYEAWWSDSEVNVLVEDIREQLLEGIYYVTVYIPHGSLKDGNYGIELSVQGGSNYISDAGGAGCSYEFDMKDGVLRSRGPYAYEEWSTGYLIRLSSRYLFEEVTEGCSMVIKLHSSASGENGKLYFNNLCFLDETAGYRYIDFADEELAVSTVRLMDGKELETEIVPGNFFWIHW